jgi:isoleucyl-tRNA synthetase
MPVDYRPTVHLPKTDFPMRANLPEREPELLRRWQEERVYEGLIAKNAQAPRFVLHDGPPYANNDIHQGHALNKTLKDIVGKYRNMAGQLSDVIPGWDCHGLPIELAVDKQLGAKKRAMSQGEFRRECRKYAEKWMSAQRASFQRLGVFMRWDQPYLTMNYSYEANTVRELANFAERGSLYRQKKPVHWCPRDRTALAEAEIEYADHTSPSIYVAMQLTSDAARLAPSLARQAVWLVVWTTTPWTLPANLAIAANERFEYVAYRLEQPNRAPKLVVVAKDLLPRFLSEVAPGDLAVREATAPGLDAATVLADPAKVVACVDGAALAGHTYRHPFYDRESPVLLGEHVTLDAGTGLVHTAPGHGHEDYVLGRRHGLAVLAPVDNAGRYTDEAPGLEGLFVFDANKVIVEKLNESGHLLSDPTLSVSHSYPHCWRCDGPVLFRATDQWFISLAHGGLRAKALEAIEGEVTWVPHWGKARIQGMMENRPDWCISRQRAWGVPIVAFYCESCGDCRLDPALMRHVAGIFDAEGADAWVDRSAKELLPAGYACARCGSAEFRKETDILDVWFDSGVSFANVATSGQWPNQGFPVDLYLEGSDQHRGWFNSSLIASVGTRDRAPYRTVLTHGFVVDGQGRKLSKRLGNGVPMDVMLKKFGADIIRLWVAAEDYREDIRLSDEILNNLAEGYRKIRNTLRWLLGSLDGFDPAAHAVPAAQLAPLDRWALEMTARWVERMHEGYANYEFHLAYHATIEFVSKTLSAFYFDVLKDRLYTRAVNDPLRRGSQTVLWRIADALTRMLAPILSFTSDEAWRLLPGHGTPNVFLAGLPTAAELRAGLAPGEGAELVARYEALQQTIRGPVQKALEELKAAQQPLFRELKELEAKERAGALTDAERARRAAVEAQTIGNSLDAQVTLHATGELAALARALLPELPELLLTSQVQLADAAPEGGRSFEGLAVRIEPARGQRCARCWCYTEQRGADAGHPELCPKCASAVRADFPAFPAPAAPAAAAEVTA